MLAGLQSFEDLTRSVGFASKMAPSHGCCQEALPFSVGLLECLHDMAGKFSQSKQSKRGQSERYSVFFFFFWLHYMLVGYQFPNQGWNHARCIGSIVLTTGTPGSACNVLYCLNSDMNLMSKIISNIAYQLWRGLFVQVMNIKRWQSGASLRQDIIFCPLSPSDLCLS